MFLIFLNDLILKAFFCERKSNDYILVFIDTYSFFNVRYLLSV